MLRRANVVDAGALGFLKSLPPVVNVVPDAHHVSVGERAGGMLLALLGVEAAVEFWGGNTAVTRPDGEIPVGSGRRLAAHAVGWSLAGLAAGALMVGVRRRRRSLLAIGGMMAVGWVTLGSWPPFALMSPELTTRWLFLGAQALPGSITGPARALAERGEYLATIAPCGLCHTPASAFAGFLNGRTMAGGMEMGGGMTMVPVESIPLPAGEQVVLEPGHGGG